MNPFKVGKEYSREHFIDRDKELAYMKQVSESGNNLVLLAPRRFGKTWLLHRFAEETPHTVVYVDLFGVISLKGFAMQIIDRSFKILKAKDPVAFVSRYLKNLARYVSFTVALKNVTFSLSPEVDDETLLNESYNLLSSLASTLKKRVIVIIDEFQEYERIHANLPESLRSFFQSENRVSFIFAGSRRHMLEKLFFHNSGTLFRSALRLDIETYLPKDECIAYAKGKFKNSHKNLSDDAADLIYELTRGHPYFFQLLCFEVWNRTENTATVEIVRESFEALLDREAYSYDALIDQLGYRYAKNVLALLSMEGQDIFSQDALRKYEIPNPAIVNKTIRVLSEYGIVEKIARGKYLITDPLFEKYIQRRMNL
ncbi:AAA family ATPase [Thermotoga caldifontis]|uniref:AAA family ATPase n=1 Tax=Thermotoga caldifontis TaxID=1508419 RepID=UPI000596E236|nr:ATP-binding protein [Thermotoga caldifontis]